MSDQQAADLDHKIDQLIGRRWSDSMFRWCAGIATALLTAWFSGSIMNLNTTIERLEASVSTQAVSNAQMRGTLDLLNRGLEASRELLGANMLSTNQQVERIAKHLESLDARVRDLERRRPLGNLNR